MRVPKKVVVGAFTYPIKFVDDLRGSDGQQLWGHISFIAPQEISIKRSGSEERIAVTLLHEIMHGIEEATDLDLDESAITLLSTHLLATIRRNKLDFLDTTS